MAPAVSYRRLCPVGVLLRPPDKRGDVYETTASMGCTGNKVDITFFPDDAILSFVSPDFDDHAQLIYNTLLITKLTFENAWAVFSAMLPLTFPLPYI